MKYPLYQREPIENLLELVNRSAKLYGDKEAIVWSKKGTQFSKSYNDIKKDSEAVANGLNGLELKLGHFAVLGATSYEWIIAYLGVVNGGNVIVPIDKELGEREIAKLLNESDSEYLIYDDDYDDLLPYLSENNKELRFIKFSELINSYSFDSKKQFFVDNNKMSVILFTSGTTGKSKGVMLCHRNIAKNIICGLSAVDLYTKDRCLSTLPINHAYEFTCDILGMLYAGVTIYINDSLKNINKNLINYKPTILFVVPMFVETMHRKIWDEARKKGKEKKLKLAIKFSNTLRKMGIDVRKRIFAEVLSSFGGELKNMLCGGAPLNNKYIDDFKSFGINLFQGYGITECSPLVAVNADRWSKKNSVGKKVIYSDIKIIEGEICVKGEIVMLGYYKNKQATEDSFDGCWFKTGDMGYIDDDCFIYITGRKKNLIILSNGENVSAEELEEMIREISLVREVIVYGKDNIITAEIYTEDKTPGCELLIKNHIKILNKNLPKYKQINNVIFRKTEFEKTTTKKIKRIEVR